VEGTEIVVAQRVIVVKVFGRLTTTVIGSPGFCGAFVVVKGVETVPQRVIVV
jgi:hypothetical protein